MTSLLVEEVAQYLATNGMGTYADSGGTLFVANMPDGVDNAVCIYETQGLAPDIDIPVHYPSFQILVRNTDFYTGQALVKSIRDLLHNQYNMQFVTNGTYIFNCNATGEGGHIGRDEKARDLFSLNFQCRTR